MSTPQQSQTKTEGAIKGGDGRYVFDLAGLSKIDAGPGYSTAHGPVVEGDVVRGKPLFGGTVRVPLDEVLALDVYQGKAAYLSDRKPDRADESGFLGPAWPWAADRTVRGEPLEVLTPNGAETFDKGLGTHPRTVLGYALGGKYRRLSSS